MDPASDTPKSWINSSLGPWSVHTTPLLGKMTNSSHIPSRTNWKPADYVAQFISTTIQMAFKEKFGRDITTNPTLGV